MNSAARLLRRPVCPKPEGARSAISTVRNLASAIERQERAARTAPRRRTRRATCPAFVLEVLRARGRSADERIVLSSPRIAAQLYVLLSGDERIPDALFNAPLHLLRDALVLMTITRSATADHRFTDRRSRLGRPTGSAPLFVGFPTWGDPRVPSRHSHATSSPELRGWAFNRAP